MQIYLKIDYQCNSVQLIKQYSGMSMVCTVPVVMVCHVCDVITSLSVVTLLYLDFHVFVIFVR